MKNRIYLLSAILFLSSCGGNGHYVWVEDAKEVEISSPIIGNPVKFGSLEIAQHDFEKEMTWDDAKKACAALGDGWRLPTKEELNDLYVFQNEIGVFAAACYWSSSEYNYNLAWDQGFNYGFQGYNLKNNTFCVRAVRGSIQSAIQNNKILFIIGDPIKFGSLEIAQHDFEKYMTWDDAKKACAALGDGWRLPTKEELNELYKHQDEIGGFAANLYWSSSEKDIGYAWYQGFGGVDQQYDSMLSDDDQNHDSKLAEFYVRAVRALKN
jgi:hypothetical protein